jgi:hypothetical protein
VVLLAEVRWTFRVWVLPFLSALAPSERHTRDAGQRHKSLTEWAWQLLALVRRWYPEREIVAVADSTYASLRLLERCRKVFNPINFTMIVLYATFSVRWDLQIALVFALLILFAGTIAYFKGALSRNIVIGAMGIWLGLLGNILL